MNKNLYTFAEAQEKVKINHFTKKGFDICGVVHIGTNYWYELPFYMQMGIENIVGFEPLGWAVEKVLKKYGDTEAFMSGKAGIYNFALGDFNGYMDLHLANGDGQSSTFLELTPEYRETFKEIEFIGDKSCMVMTFEKFMKTHKEFNIADFNCLVLDVEGMELRVLQGMGNKIKKFDFLNIELSGEPTYIDGPDAQTVIDYLKTFNFIQDSPIEPHNDVIFIRKDLL